METHSVENQGVVQRGAERAQHKCSGVEALARRLERIVGLGSRLKQKRPSRSQGVCQFALCCYLPVATVKSSATVEPAAMKLRVPACMAAELMPVPVPSWPVTPSRTIETRSPIVAVVSRTPVPMPMRVIPRTHTNERAVDEIIRPPVSIRRAAVRCIRVVAIRANWLRSDIRGTDTNSHSNAHLRMSSAGRQKRGQAQNTEQSRIFEISHILPLS